MEEEEYKDVDEFEQCKFCGAQAFVSLERQDEMEIDLERDLLLVCDNCEKTFWKICKVLKLGGKK